LREECSNGRDDAAAYHGCVEGDGSSRPKLRRTNGSALFLVISEGEMHRKDKGPSVP
jgi:hypothetical protein